MLLYLSFDMRNALVLFIAAGVSACAGQQFDVVVYGGTAGGAMAAIAAAKEGVRVALLEPGRHVGGMLTGGLGRTDMDRQQNVIGGLSREFFERAGKHYGQPIAWLFEPSVAEKILKDWLAEAGVRVIFEQRLGGIGKRSGRITSLRTTSGQEYQAPVYIDSSYEGDLMKAAGVSYAVGRDSRALYRESLAGRQDFLTGGHQFRVEVAALGDDGKLLPYVQPQETLEDTGQGGKKFQSYCFRICLTCTPANRLPLPKPKGTTGPGMALPRHI
jgi:hypothetical protein